MLVVPEVQYLLLMEPTVETVLHLVLLLTVAAAAVLALLAAQRETGLREAAAVAAAELAVVQQLEVLQLLQRPLKEVMVKARQTDILALAEQ